MTEETIPAWEKRLMNLPLTPEEEALLARQDAERYPLAILNTSIVTEDGAYTMTTITLEEARQLVQSSGIDSAVGHEATAALLTTLLGVDIETDRQLFSQQPGQRALVCKLNGRPPEGRVLSLDELEEIGYSFKLLTRTA